MDEQEAVQLINLGVASFTAISELVHRLKQKSGLTDEQLVAKATEMNADTGQRLQAFLVTLPAA